MGFSAKAHITGHEFLEARRLAVLAGLGVRDGEHIRNPFVEHFSLTVIATDYELATDRPLHADALKARGWHYYSFIGVGGARLMCSWKTTPEDITRFIDDVIQLQ